MDRNLIFIVLFVALCWMSFGTNAQNDTTAAANTTTPANTSSVVVGTTNGTAAGTTNGTAAGTTNGTAAGTTNGTAVGGTNGTNSNVTTPAPTITAPPLVPNTTVVDLPTNVSSAGCGSTQLCAAQPSSCDPSNSDSCFFLGAKQTSGHNFEFSLSGVSEGFLAAALSSPSGGNSTSYICAKSKGGVKFISGLFNLATGQFFNLPQPVNNVKGKINGNKIQCTFAVTVPTATTKAGDTAFSMGVVTGPYNDTTDSPGTPTTRIQTAPLDLSNPNQTVINVANATNTTSAPSTTVTTPAPTTTAPPLVPDTTVVDLPTPVSSAGCGSTQLCAAEPSSCDPSKLDSCFFFGAKPTSGFNFVFSLSGVSEGYLAAALSSPSRVNDTVYICAKNNSVVKFIPALFSNGQFFDTVLLVNNVQGKINGNKIQCTFAVTVPNATARSGDTSFALGVETGSYDTTTGKKGSPTLKIKTAVLDLSNPKQTVTNLLAPTTSGAITLQQSVSQAVLIVLGFLSLAML